ncbi:MAG: glycine cleavage system aminomethyltransferase GcvT [Bacteroidaceae bacterium]|nr:glycine cleavage system aminomethyltransferase GcvT [Bacteroidaceae bacterium]
MEKKTCLYDRHVALGALMSPFGGFIMPIQYSNITDEHNAVRQHCGVFDVSHMGEVRITGPDAEKYVQHIFTNDVSGAPVGQIYYGMMLYPNGGTVDDLLVYKMGENDFFLVINAANIDKDVAWMKEQAAGFDIKLDHQSDYYGQLAVQGPEAEKVVEEVLGIPCSELKFYTAKVAAVPDGFPSGQIIISRTGYTGEDGFEIYGSHEFTQKSWDKLIESGRCKPCGLGCRDTLRFEVGLPLYGDELSADISPVMAGLSMFCKLDKEEFIGKEALVEQKANGVPQKLVGIELADKAIPRHGYPVLNMDGEVVGEVTTGYHCLSVDKSVCMALVKTEFAKLDTPLQVQIRKKVFPGVVVKKKFYDKHYKK